MDCSRGYNGSLIPFRPLVLDADGATPIPPPAGPSEGTRKLRALADAPATLRAYAAYWRHFGRWCLEQRRQPFDKAESLGGASATIWQRSTRTSP